MNREDFYYDSRDGKTKIHAVRWTGAYEGKPKAIIQIIHGMAEYVDRYEDFASFLVENGYVVVANDHLGHGKSLTDKGTGYFCKQDPSTVVVRDVHRLKKLTQEKYQGVPYIILGHSMGSFILRNYLFRYGKGIDGAVIMGTGMAPKALTMALKFMARTACVFGKAAVPSQFIDNLAFGSYQKKIENPRTKFDWLSKNEESVDKYIEDPLCGFTFTANGFCGLADLILGLHKKSNIEKMPVTLPVLFVSGSDDPVGNYGEDVKKVYKSFLDEGMQKVEIKLYENDRHELLNELDRDVVYKDILNWINEAI